MEVARAEAFNIDMECHSSLVQVPEFLKNRLSKPKKAQLTKEQLQEKLSRAEALRLSKLDERKLYASNNSIKVQEGYDKKQNSMIEADYYMMMCHGNKNPGVIHQASNTNVTLHNADIQEDQ